MPRSLKTENAPQDLYEAVEELAKRDCLSMRAVQIQLMRAGLVVIRTGFGRNSDEIRPKLGRNSDGVNPRNSDAEREGGGVLAKGVQEVWDYYTVTIGRNPKLYTLTPKRKAMGMARLKDLMNRSGSTENAVKLMKLCVDRLHRSPFHNGQNDQHRKYLNWEVLFRSTEQMEKWLDDERWKGVM